MKYNYVLIAAYVQCGDKPPYNCMSIPVRMNEDMPQIKIRNDWIDCPKDGKRPDIVKYYGMPVAGISTDWKIL